MPCRHCQRDVVDYSRGLCKPCYQDVRIRVQYPAQKRFQRHWEYEPSMEELETLIAQQLPTMPRRKMGDK